jgi:DtxR family transcriptional regulator, Mn-dependent transcriptional regulator
MTEDNKRCSRATIWIGVKITISKENYLKAIAEAESEGETVIAATLARWLNVSAPAVTMAVKRLRRDSLIDVGREGQLTLTAKGREIANHLLNRHHLIERMLTEIFEMEWYKVHEEAEQLEHAVSEDFEQKLVEKLGTEEPCPHGNRVDSDTPTERRRRGLLPLDEIDAACRVEIVSVFERDRRLLEYLDGLGVRPGVRLTVVTRNYDDTMNLDTGTRNVQLGLAAAERVWVRPL